RERRTSSRLHRKGAAMPMAKLLTRRAFDPETTSLLGAAFDKAWQTVQTSGSPLAAEKHAAATREILAKKILAAGHRGERNMNRLVEEALALLIICKDTSARRTNTGGNEAHIRAVELHPLRVALLGVFPAFITATGNLNFASQTEKDMHKVGTSSK